MMSDVCQAFGFLFFFGAVDQWPQAPFQSNCCVYLSSHTRALEWAPLGIRKGGDTARGAPYPDPAVVKRALLIRKQPKQDLPEPG
jgi:hypothetical protein